MSVIEIQPFYSDEVRFYADKRKKSIIRTKSIYKGKGWWSHIVGDYTIPSRNKDADMKLMAKYYPTYKRISLFSETSYHSGFNYPNKITRYGTKDYTLQYSSYKPIATYTLEQPVKTSLRNAFAKVINKVTLLEWNYIVLNWQPIKNDIVLQITHKVSTPFTPTWADVRKIIFQSRRYTLAEKNKAIKDFRDYVAKVTKKKTSVRTANKKKPVAVTKYKRKRSVVRSHKRAKPRKK